MEHKKYELYTTEDFILDKEFAHWVLFPNSAEDSFWMSYQSLHPEKINLMKEAALIINSLKPINPEIPEEKLEQIFRKIKYQHKTRHRLINITIRYAAAVTFLLTIGTVLWFSVKKNDPFPVEASLSSPQKGKVILANGTVHEFETEKTIIKQTVTGKTAINNDTVNVNAQEKTTNNPGLNQVIVPYGKNSEITLADGTHIWLNSEIGRAHV